MVLGFSMMTSFEPSETPIITSAVVRQKDQIFLNVKTASYIPEYLGKLFEKNNDSETSLLDSYEVVSSDYVAETPSREAKEHALNHCRFSINTLMPLFVGYQSKRSWSVTQNKGPALIFKETSNRLIQLKELTKVYGCVTLKDYYTSEKGSLVGVYGVTDKPVIVPIEILPNNVTVRCLNSHFILNYLL